MVKTKQNYFYESPYRGNQWLQPESFMCDSSVIFGVIAQKNTVNILLIYNVSEAVSLKSSNI